MDLVKLTESIIKKLVVDPDSVSVKEFATEEENTIQIIGRNGKIINSIRTIVQASSSIYDNKKVKINVDSY